MGDDKKKEIRPLKELSVYCRRYLPAILVSLLLGGAGAVFSVVGPDRIADMVNVIEQGLTGSMDLGRIGQIGVFLAILYGLGGVFGYGQQYILTTVTQRMSKRLRTEISRKSKELITDPHL